jgi:hypothetical protein
MTSELYKKLEALENEPNRFTEHQIKEASGPCGILFSWSMGQKKLFKVNEVVIPKRESLEKA